MIRAPQRSHKFLPPTNKTAFTMIFSTRSPTCGIYPPWDSSDYSKTSDEFFPKDRDQYPSSSYLYGRRSPADYTSGKLGRHSLKKPSNYFFKEGYDGRLSPWAHECDRIPPRPRDGDDSPSPPWTQGYDVPPPNCGSDGTGESLSQCHDDGGRNLLSDLCFAINQGISKDGMESSQYETTTTHPETKRVSPSLGILNGGRPILQNSVGVIYQPPSTNCEEDRDKITFELDVPGFQITDLEIVLHEDKLEVSGARATKWGDNVVFLKQFVFDPEVIDASPNNVDDDEGGPSSITASLDTDGVLSITIRKKEQSVDQRSRCLIPIRTSRASKSTVNHESKGASKRDDTPTSTPFLKKGFLLCNPDNPKSSSKNREARKMDPDGTSVRNVDHKPSTQAPATPTLKKGFLLSPREGIAADKASKKACPKTTSKTNLSCRTTPPTIRRGFLLDKKKKDEHQRCQTGQNKTITMEQMTKH